MIVQTGLTFGEHIGESFLLVDEGASHPYRVATEKADVVSLATGWCKTISHCEKVLAKLSDDGYAYAGEINLKQADTAELFRWGITRFPLVLVKSAVQKYIRRGHTQKAVDCAWAILRGDSSDWWLKRRLRIIAVEDVGWDLQVPSLESDADVLRTVAALAEAAKNREASSLFSITMAEINKSQDIDLPPWPSVVEKALAMCRGHKQNQMDLFEGHLTPGPVGLMHMSMYRQGLGFWDMFLMLCAVALDDGRELVPLDEGSMIDPQPLAQLDWWTQDQHTFVGKAALKKFDSHRSFDDLGDIQFYCESDTSAPLAEQSLLAEGRQANARRLGFSTYPDMVDWWEGVLRDDIRKSIERHLVRFE